jgi:hypothetical protein
VRLRPRSAAARFGAVTALEDVRCIAGADCAGPAGGALTGANLASAARISEDSAVFAVMSCCSALERYGQSSR